MQIPLPNSDQFVLPVQKPTQQSLDNFVGNIAALQDPSGTLERMQAEQVAKSIADVKLEGIDQKYKGLAIDAINNYQNKSMQLYKGNKGFNRLNLDAKQLLEEQSNYRDLLTNINAAKQLTERNAKTIEEVGKAFVNNTITKEDYDEFNKIITEKENAVKQIGDIPDYRAIFNNYLQGKPQKWDANKSTGMYKTPEQWAKAVNYPQMGETASAYDVAQAKDLILTQFGSGEWQQSTRPMLIQNGIIKQGMTPSQELEAGVDYARRYFNPAENRKSGGMTIYNSAGGKDKLTPREIKKDGYTYYNFSAKPVKDSYGEYSGNYTNVKVDPDGTTWVYLKQLVNGKGEPIDVNKALTYTEFKNAGARTDPNKNGGLWLPYNDQVEWALQSNDYNVNGMKVKKGQYTVPGKPEVQSEVQRITYRNKSGEPYDGKIIYDKWVERNGRHPSKQEWWDFINSKGLKPKK